jgi:type IV secretory pathway TraG/TraD family ATPase VirD4
MIRVRIAAILTPLVMLAWVWWAWRFFGGQGSMLDLQFLLKVLAGQARYSIEAMRYWWASLGWVGLAAGGAISWEAMPWGGMVGWAWSTWWLLPLGWRAVATTAPLAVLAILATLVPSDRPRVREARWAEGRELPSYDPRYPSIALGLKGGVLREREVGVRADHEGVHTLAILRTGAGKSSLMARQLWSWPGGAIALDPKGELWDRTAARREEIGPVYCLRMGDARTHAWDPLASQPDAAIDALCVDPAEREPYWGQAAARELRRIHRSAKANGQNTWTLLADLVRLPATQAAKRLAEIGVEVDRDSREWQSTWATIQTRLQVLDQALPMLSGCDFLVDMLRHRHGTAYLVVPPALLRPAAPLLRAVWTGLMYDLLQPGPPCLALLDEAGVVSPPGLPDLLALARGYRVSVLAAVQSLSQLHAAYGSQAQSALDNCRAVLVGASEDPATCEWVSAKMGTYEETIESRGRSWSWSSESAHATRSTRRRRLLDPDEVRLLNEDQWLLFLAGRRPALVGRYTWGVFPETHRRPKDPPLRSLPPLKPLQPQEPRLVD